MRPGTSCAIVKSPVLLGQFGQQHKTATGSTASDLFVTFAALGRRWQIGGDAMERDIEIEWCWSWPLSYFLRSQKVVYRGSGTVWHELETGRRANTSVEYRLSEIEWKLKQDERAASKA
jgi:hypothetical protein